MAQQPHVPHCEHFQKTLPKTGQLLIPGPAHKFEIDHEHFEANQLDFYLPAAIYKHSATRHFIQRISQLAPGATLFRGATGVWQDEEEDTYIYRLIVRSSEFPMNRFRPIIRSEIQKLMAELGEWHESRQFQFLFTETTVCVNTADLLNPPNYRRKATRRKKRKTTGK